jgi:hypothetical protein
MKENVKNFMHTCVKCQNMKFIYKNIYGLYRPLLIPSEPWNNVSMDFMMQLLEWNGMDVILVVINQFSKLAKIVPTNMIITNFNSLKLLFDMWVRHHRMLQYGCHVGSNQLIFQVGKIISTNMIVTTFDSTKLFFDMWIRHHRMLQFIVIDRDTKFMVGFWKQ